MIEHTAPIILDLGKKKRRALKDLKRGRGRLMDEVEQSLEEVRVSLGEEMQGKQIVPIILVYKRKEKKRKGLGRIW
jgi:hypothetical protein